MALLALARHYVSEGWRSRGSAFARDTSQKQIAAMRALFEHADKLLGEALESNPKLSRAWELRLSVARGTGDDALRERAPRSALAIHPLLFRAREHHMLGATRRWARSYEQLDRLAREAQRYADQNPRLVLLLGFSAWVRGRDMEVCGPAIGAYDEALAHGEHWRFLYKRGWCRRKMESLSPLISLYPLRASSA